MGEYTPLRNRRWFGHCRGCGFDAPLDQFERQSTIAGPCDYIEVCPKCDETTFVELYWEKSTDEE